MRKAYLVVIGFIAFTAAFAQSIDELDKKAGFKEFHIGDSLRYMKARSDSHVHSTTPIQNCIS